MLLNTQPVEPAVSTAAGHPAFRHAILGTPPVALL